MLIWAEDILRGKSQVIEQGSTRRKILHISCVLIVFGFLYGAVMGSYFESSPPRPLQMLYSGIKVPLLLMITFALSLPFFFVLNSLFGLRPDFKQVLRALLATQAGLTVILASLSPLTLVWYVSFVNYPAAILVNAVMFGIASISAQLALRRFYKSLILKNRLHKKLLTIWILIYAFVGIQLGWVLRPFIGDPDGPTQFLRENAWGNAYIKLIEIALRSF